MKLKVREANCFSETPRHQPTSGRTHGVEGEQWEEMEQGWRRKVGIRPDLSAVD